MQPPDYVSPDYVEVGDNIMPLLPTNYLRFDNGRLMQWFEASYRNELWGSTHVKGEWRPVPST